MANIVIRKHISLDFLGERHKDDFLVFKSMPWRVYEDMLPLLEKEGNDSLGSAKVIRKALTDHFLEGKFQNEDVSKDDLFDFDIDTLTKCFEQLTGQVPPKD